jgi:hypothetical protein
MLSVRGRPFGKNDGTMQSILPLDLIKLSSPNKTQVCEFEIWMTKGSWSI